MLALPPDNPSLQARSLLYWSQSKVLDLALGLLVDIPTLFGEYLFLLSREQDLKWKELEVYQNTSEVNAMLLQ